MLRVIAFIFSIFIFTQSIFSQEYDTDVIEDEVENFKIYLMEPSFSIYFPEGNFSRQLDGKAFIGASFAMLFQLQNEMPSFAGFDLYYGWMDSYSNSWFGFFDNGDPAEYDGNATSNLIGLSGLYRYYPSISFWRIEPFIEGAFGFKWMFSSQTVTSFFEGIEETNDYEVITSDLSLTYGIGAGIQILLGGNAYLNVKASYLPGNSAEYDVLLPNDQIGNIEDPIQAFELNQSATNVLKLDTGVTLVF